MPCGHSVCLPGPSPQQPRGPQPSRTEPHAARGPRKAGPGKTEAHRQVQTLGEGHGRTGPHGERRQRPSRRASRAPGQLCCSATDASTPHPPIIHPISQKRKRKLPSRRRRSQDWNRHLPRSSEGPSRGRVSVRPRHSDCPLHLAPVSLALSQVACSE